MNVVYIETAMLILRTVTMADVDGVASSWNLDEGPISTAEAEQKIKSMLSNHAQNRPGKLLHLCLAIISKETDEFIGWCGLDHTNPADADPALFYNTHGHKLRLPARRSARRVEKAQFVTAMGIDTR
jgi:hypothetical protein